MLGHSGEALSMHEHCKWVARCYQNEEAHVKLAAIEEKGVSNVALNDIPCHFCDGPVDRVLNDALRSWNRTFEGSFNVLKAFGDECS